MVKMGIVIIASIFKCGLCVLKDIDFLNVNRIDIVYDLYLVRKRMVEVCFCEVCRFNVEFIYKFRVKCTYVRRRGYIVCRICYKVVVNAFVLYFFSDDR